MRSCPVCEARNDDDARYCELCGQRLSVQGGEGAPPVTSDVADDQLAVRRAPAEPMRAAEPKQAAEPKRAAGSLTPVDQTKPAVWPAVLLGIFSVLLPGLGIPLGIAAMLLGQSRFLSGRRAGGLIALLLGLLGFLSSVAIIVVLVLRELGVSLRVLAVGALLLGALTLAAGARAQRDFCPANAMADTAMACLACSKTRSCAADPRCSRARCCVARCWPACGVQAGDCFGVDCACDDGAETIPWEVVVVALGVLGSGATIAAVLRRRKRRAGKGGAPAGDAGEAPDDSSPGRSFSYVLQVSAPRISLTPRKAMKLEVSAWRVDDLGRVSPATEARIEVGAHPDDGLLELTSDGLTWRKELTLRVGRARGAEVARQTATEAIEVPADQSMVIGQELRIVAEALDSRLQHKIPVDVELSRWFQLCAAAKSGWIWNKPDMERETHLRVNRATLWRDFKRATAAHDAGEGPPTRMEHVHAKDNADCVDAGIFLFAHNPGKRRGSRYYLTPPDEIGDVEKNINTWIQKGRYDAPVKAPEMTEAGLAVDLLRDWAAGRKRPLTPGDVLRHALRHTSGELTGALLLAHNTLRALARGEGDALGTGLTSHRHLFDQVFQPMRSGLRCIDGTDEERAAGKLDSERPAGGPSLGTKFEAGLAADNAGCWYHLFGTAFYEAYTAERTSLGNTDGWGDFGNSLEQWYREYSPNSWQDPDYEKYCFNIWGIWLARQLIKEHG